MSRRSFLGTAAGAAMVASLSSPLTALAQAAAATSTRKRLAIVGTGWRGTGMWGVPVARDFSDRVEFVGLCDINPKRVAYAATIIGQGVPTFTDFDEMIRTAKPDTVIVTTIDSFHAHYLKRAMELGCDVICEKPLCTDAGQAQSIVDVCRKTGRNLIVTFNARHHHSAMKMKELLLAGEIGEIYSADYAEFLGADHGGSYFRRWHAFKANSGTLLCQKSSHHFDQLNWWLGSEPVEVTAYGRLAKYGINGPFRHANCRACLYKDKCDMYWDITKHPQEMALYVANESADGYYRDGCVYRTSIDIYDSMRAQFKYANNVLVSYSLDATGPYEGSMVTLNGSRGRIELRTYVGAPWEPAREAELRITRNGGKPTMIDLPRLSEDEGIRKMIFHPETPDPLAQRAGLRAGLVSALMGIGAYTSIDTGHKVNLVELVKFT